MIYAVLLSLHLTTIGVSVGIKSFKESQLFKDVLNTGYKINLQKLNEYNHNLSIYDKKRSKISYFIPIFNIIGVLQSKEEYNYNYERVTRQLDAMDCLIPLTEKEKKSFEAYPTGSTAYLISADIDISYPTFDCHYHESVSDKNKYIITNHNFDHQTETNKKEELIELRNYLKTQTSYDEDVNLVLKKDIRVNKF